MPTSLIPTPPTEAYHRALDLVAHMPDTAGGIYVDDNYPITTDEVPPMCLVGALSMAMNLVDPDTSCPIPDFWYTPEYTFVLNAIQLALGADFCGVTHYFDEFNRLTAPYSCRQMTKEQLSAFFEALINDTPIPLPSNQPVNILQYAD